MSAIGVMPAPVAGIHDFSWRGLLNKAWMAGTGPAKTSDDRIRLARA